MLQANRDISFKTIWWLIILSAILICYYLFDPLQAWWMPQCIFHKITGYQCMGCGAQRALHALLHGDLKSAWIANGFLVCSLPVLAFLVYVELSRTRHPGLYKRVHTKTVIIVISALLVAWLIIRNILGI